MFQGKFAIQTPACLKGADTFLKEADNALQALACLKEADIAFQTPACLKEAV